MDTFYDELSRITSYIKDNTHMHKYAASRVVKDARALLMKHKGLSSRDVKKMDTDSLYNNLYQMDKSKQPSPQEMEVLRKELGLRRIERDRLDQQSRSILEDAMAQRRMKRLYSGRHKPRGGEEFIPASGRKYRSLGTDDDNGKYLYRGNPLPKEQRPRWNATPAERDDIKLRNYAWTSRHPGIAAAIAMSGEVTPTSKRMFKFKRPLLTTEGSSVGMGIFGPKATPRIDPKSKDVPPLTRRKNRYFSKNTAINTVEAVSGIDRLQPNLVAEYKVRPSFHKGQVGFAAKRIK